VSASISPFRLPPEAILDDASNRHLKRRSDIHFAVLSKPSEQEQAFRLRAMTAIARWHLPAETFPNGLDTDEDDANATHLGGWKDGALVAAARLIPAVPGKLLPIEKHFDVIVPDRSSVIEVGRVMVRDQIVDRRSTGLTALIGSCWQHADDRHLWVGPNTDAVIRLYEMLGARPIRLGEPREFMGETRTPVMWNMWDFSEAFLALAERGRRTA
jgi:hypothetical protein